MTKAKRWKDGKEFYSKGIAVLTQKRITSKKQPASSIEESRNSEGVDEIEERALEEACYINRALCNLELSLSSLGFELEEIVFDMESVREL